MVRIGPLLYKCFGVKLDIPILKNREEEEIPWGTIMAKKEVIDKIIRVFSKFIDREDIETGNRYLLAAVETLIYEYLAGEYTDEELSEIARTLRDKIVEGPAYANPFIMEVLGILEEEVNENNIKDALERIRELHMEERLDRLEV